MFAKSTAIIATITIIATAGYADTVYLKNGRQMDGVIVSENSDCVELAILAGSVKFYREQIDHVEHSSKEENQTIQDDWRAEHQERQAELRRRQAEEFGKRAIEAERKGDHLLVKALFNNKASARLMVDTGSSDVMLSLKKARELGLEIGADKPDTGMKLADGTEVTVKIFTLESVNVEGAEARDVEVAVPVEENVLSDLDGLLGMSFLKLFKFEIDLENNRLLLEKLET